LKTTLKKENHMKLFDVDGKNQRRKHAAQRNFQPTATQIGRTAKEKEKEYNEMGLTSQETSVRHVHFGC